MRPEPVDRFFSRNGREFFEGDRDRDFENEDSPEKISQNQQEHDLVLFFGEDDPEEWKGDEK